MSSPDFSLIDLPGFLGDNIVSPVYSDGSPLPLMLDAINRTQNLAGQRQDPSARFWSTPPRPQDSPLGEVMEVSLASAKLMNRVQFDLPHFPHEARLEFYNPENATWNPVREDNGSNVIIKIYDSNPPILPTLVAQQGSGHPQHFGANHWEHYDIALLPFSASRVRMVLHRMTAGSGPLNQLGDPVPYSLGVRGFNIGYRVEDRTDIPADDPQVLEAFVPPTMGEHPPFANTLDILGSTISYSLRERNAEQLTQGGIWKSEPQPVNYAVVNLYIDVQQDGEPQVVDRLYLEPLTSGPSLNVYYTNDLAFDTATWTPVNRDFKLRRGFYHLLPTKARFLKLEFSNLTPEPYESNTSIVRTVTLFPEEALGSRTVEQSGNIGNAGLSVMASLDSILRFRDNDRPSQTTYALNAGGYTATEVFHTNDPVAADRLRNLSPLYNFHTWHSAAGQPRFVQTQPHHYVLTEVAHDQRVAYYVGLRSIEVFRLDYTADDDTDQYLDLFYDDHMVASNTGWVIEENNLHTPTSGSGPWVITSKVLYSRSPVAGIQYATTQSPAVQLLPDDDFNYGALGQDQLNLNWQGVGDCIGPVPSNDYNTDIGTTVRVARQGTPEAADQIPHTWRGIERKYRRWSQINNKVTYGDLDNPDPGPTPFGGIQHRAQISPMPGSRIYASARVISPTRLAEPLYVQIYDVLSNTVLAEAEADIPANQVVEWYCAYTAGDGGTLANVSWDEREDGSTYGDYESRSWYQMQQDQIETAVSLRVRLIQRGLNTGHWNVDTLSMFEESIRWEFSNDGGARFFPAFLIRNDPDGALVFPADPLQSDGNTWDDLEARFRGVQQQPAPTWDSYNDVNYEQLVGLPGIFEPPVQNALVWRVTCARPNQHVNGLSIRPLYEGPLHGGGIPSRDGMQAAGANNALYDHYQPIHEDPRYRLWHKPIPQSWYFFYRQFLLLRHESDIQPPPMVILDESLYGLPVTPMFLSDTLSPEPPV